MYTWNETAADYLQDKTIPELFKEQVIKTPNNVAVVYEDKRLSYQELNSNSNQLAHYLIDTYNIKNDDLIALCLDRNMYMIIVILAVLKSGGAYVPLDPGYPEERIKYILADTESKVLITNNHHFENLSRFCESSAAISEKDTHSKNDWNLSNCYSAAGGNRCPNIIIIDNPDFNLLLEGQSISNPNLNITSNNLAYVIYTSGTTGKPKGVLQLHKNVARLFSATNDWYKFNSNDVWTLFHSYVFDFSVWEIWGALIYGGKLVIPSIEITRDTELFYSLCQKECITVLNQTPNAFYQFIDMSISKEQKLSCLRYVIFGGDVLNLGQLKPWFEYYGDSKPSLINMYGITETTVHVTYKKLSLNDIGEKSYIGKVIPDMKSYILDINLNPLPIGAIGELYVGGLGLARGYLNLPELTREKFISNPFQTEQERMLNQNSRLYKTGDLVRYLPDGSIEYIGRNDFQVKIRGFRIELGEIESKLSTFPEVTQAIVLAKEHMKTHEDSNGNKYLAAYYVANSKLDEDKILKYLHEELPDYMVPSVLVYLDRLPLTINGKLDRKSLPDPEFKPTNEYVAPRNELELQVCNIYAEVLAIDAAKIGMRDDFFRLGGNSILAIKLVSRLNNHVLHDNKINVAAIFKYKNIANLLGSILSDDNHPQIIIPKLPKDYTKYIDLSFAQERLWFIESYQGGTNAYNIPMLYKLSKKTNIELLIGAIQATVARHEVLHTFIKTGVDGSGYQKVGELQAHPLMIEISEIACSQEYKLAIVHEVNYIFKLDQEYPIRIHLFVRNDTGETYLLIIVHHIAFDGWSMDVLLRDINAYYDYAVKLSNSEPAVLELEELEIQYKDFAIWQRDYLSGARLEHQLEYWSNKLSGYENLNLMTDYPRPQQISYLGEDEFFNLDKGVTNKLKQLAQEVGVSLYSVLLSGFNLLLRAYSNQNDIIIGTPIANRHHAQLENMVGFFVNSLALRSQINPEYTIQDYIKQTGSEIIEAQLHQDLPFEKLVDELNVAKDTSCHPIFQVMFGVQSFGRKKTNAPSLLIETSYKELNYKVAKFDLMLMIDDGGDKLEGVFNYATSLYTKSTIEGFIETYIQILKQFSTQSKKLIKDLNYLSELNYKQIVYTWNKTEHTYPANKTIHQLFEEQVTKTPDNIAIVFEGKELGYKQLNQKANQLAHYLKDTYKIQGDDLIALCLDRSEYMIIAILAVLKSGGAYVPLDPNYPKDRITYILEDTHAKVLITNNHHSENLFSFCKLESNNCKSSVLVAEDGRDCTASGSQSDCHSANVWNPCFSILAIDTPELSQILAKQPLLNPITGISSCNLAYVIYTSGTTGKPKGVMVEHKSVINLLSDCVYRYNISAADKIVFFANFVFDASVEQMFITILSGATTTYY